MPVEMAHWTFAFAVPDDDPNERWKCVVMEYAAYWTPGDVLAAFDRLMDEEFPTADKSTLSYTSKRFAEKR